MVRAAAAPTTAHPLVVITAAGTITRQQRALRVQRRPDSRVGVRAPRSGRRAGAGRTAGALRSRPDSVVAQPAVRPVRHPGRRGGGARRRRGPFADARRLGGRHAAAGARAAVGAGVRRLVATRADGLGGGAGVPVPAADATTTSASPRFPRSGSPRTTPQRSRTPTPGRTAATAACSGSPTCCCART